MKKIILALLCLFTASVSLFADMTKSELQQMYLAFLRGNGMTASIDVNGNIEFEYEGEYYRDTCYIIVDENDQQYFSIGNSIGSFSSDITQEVLIQAVFAASAATRDAFVAKLYIIDDGDIIVSAETFLVSPGDFEAVFFKLLKGLEQAILIFVNNME